MMKEERKRLKVKEIIYGERVKGLKVNRKKERVEWWVKKRRLKRKIRTTK